MLIKILLVLGISFYYSNVKAQSIPSKEDSTELAAFYWQESNRTFNMENFDSCTYFVKKAQKIYDQLEDWPNNIFCLNSLATILSYEDRHTESFRMQDSIIILAEKHLKPGDTNLGNVYNNACANARIKGDLDLAIEFSKKAIDNVDEKNKDFKAIYYLQTGYLYSLLGDFDKALEFCFYSEKLRLDIFPSNHIKFADIYKPIGFIYREYGDFKKAIEYYNKAEKIIQERSIKNDYGPNFTSIKIAKAKVFFDDNKPLSAQKEMGDIKKDFDQFTKREQADFISLKCKVEYRINKNTKIDSVINNFKEANLLYNESMSNLKSDNQIAQNFIFLSEVYNEKNQLDKSKNILHSALDSIGGFEYKTDPNKIINKLLAIEIIQKLSNIYIKLEDLDEVDDSYFALLNLTKLISIESKSASYKKFWAQKNTAIYEKIIEYYLIQGKPEKAFQYAEQNKSNLLAYDLQVNSNKGFSNISPTDLKKEKELKSEINFLKKKIYESEKTHAPKSISILNENLIQAEIKLQSLLNRFEKVYPKYYNLKYNFAQVKVKDVQGQLNKNTVFLEYFIGEENSYAFIISKNNFELKKLKPISNLKQQIIAFKNLTKNKKSDIKELKQISNLLYTGLLKDALLENNSFDNLIIVTDDVLHNIPFDLLVNESNEYLGVEKSVSYQYSAILMNMLSNRKHENKKYDFLGYAYTSNSSNYFAERTCININNYDLLCSSKEVSDIILNIGETSSHTANNLDNLIHKAQDSRVLHLATHACYDENNNAQSKVYIEDTYFTLEDLYTMNFPNDLVVLSACESGFGNVIKGEGTMSLAKGFFHAGAKSTVVSLWPVDDCTTSDLMTLFYANLKMKMSKSDALKKAKNQFVNNAHHTQKHPYYWAGFILIGDNSPIWSSGFNYPLIIVTILAFLIIAFYLKRTTNNFSEHNK